MVTLVKRIEKQALNDEPQGNRDGDGRQHGQPEIAKAQSQVIHQIGTNHVHGTMGEINDAHNAKNQC